MLYVKVDDVSLGIAQVRISVISRQGSYYRKNLSLDEIAAQSMISKSSALNLFRRYLHITPVNYLINYRLKQAALLLSHTEKKVSTISAETGFHNVD